MQIVNLLKPKNIEFQNLFNENTFLFLGERTIEQIGINYFPIMSTEPYYTHREDDSLFIEWGLPNFVNSMVFYSDYLIKINAKFILNNGSSNLYLSYYNHQNGSHLPFKNLGLINLTDTEIEINLEIPLLHLQSLTLLSPSTFNLKDDVGIILVYGKKLNNTVPLGYLT